MTVPTNGSKPDCGPFRPLGDTLSPCRTGSILYPPTIRGGIVLDRHLIHRLDEFLPHLAALQPKLLELLPAGERPIAGAELSQWVNTLPQPRMMEICQLWVLESLTTLKERSPLTNVLIRSALLFSGEFDLNDLAAVAIGETMHHGDPRRQEIRMALAMANRCGLMIHLTPEEHFCVPFPVRLCLEGVDFYDPLEKDELRFRLMDRFRALAEDLHRDEPDTASRRYWRFANFLTAYETATGFMEESLELEDSPWYREPQPIDNVPNVLIQPLLAFAHYLGKELVRSQSERGERLLAASVSAARTLGDKRQESETLAMLARYHMCRKRFEMAISLFEQCLTLCQETGDHFEAASLRGAVAICLRDMGDLEKAIGQFIEAAKYARHWELPDPMIDTANCAAKILVEQKRGVEAATLLHDLAGPLMDEDQRYPALAETHVLLGIAARLAGEISEAAKHFEKAVELGQHFPHRPVEARARYELGLLYVEGVMEEEARECFLEAILIFNQLADYQGLASARLQLMRLEMGDQRLSAAERTFRLALRNAQTARAQELIAESWRLRKELAELQRDQRGVIDALDNEIRVLQYTGLAPELIRAHMQLGAIYLSQNSVMNAGMEVLRAQGVARQAMREQAPPEIDELINEISQVLSEDQWEYIVGEISSEMDAGELIHRKR